MRIARWIIDGTEHEGIVAGDDLIEFPSGVTTASVIASGVDAAKALAETLSCAPESLRTPLADVTLLPPLKPTSVRDFVAFEEHVEGMTASTDGVSNVPAEWYRYPTFYFTNPHSLLGDGATVTPPATEALDFELELAAIVGPVPRDGANLTPEEGAKAIFGFTVMNDWSARDVQGREMQVRLGPAKGKDFATSLGPWIVTADEFEDLIDAEGFLPVRGEAYVNDTLIGEDLFSNMGWPFGELVAYASRNARVVPGDVLGSGTAGNGGCLGELWGRNGQKTPPPLKTGDTVRLVIERIGTLAGVVGEQIPVPEIPPARKRSRARTR